MHLSAAAGGPLRSRVTCQAQTAFVVWPQPDRSQLLERRLSLQFSPSSGGNGDDATGSAHHTRHPGDQQQQQQQLGLPDPDVIQYPLGLPLVRLRWQV